MDECSYSLGTANVGMKLEGNGGYWQVELDKNDIDKTAFDTNDRLYWYTRIRLG